MHCLKLAILNDLLLSLRPLWWLVTYFLSFDFSISSSRLFPVFTSRFFCFYRIGRRGNYWSCAFRAFCIYLSFRRTTVLSKSPYFLRLVCFVFKYKLAPRKEETKFALSGGHFCIASHKLTSCLKLNRGVLIFLPLHLCAARCVHYRFIFEVAIPTNHMLLQAWQFLDGHNVALNIRRQVNDNFVGMLLYSIYFSCFVVVPAS